MIVEQEKSSKQNKLGQLKIKNYTFERDEYIKYLGVIFSEDNNHQIDLQERINNVNTYIMLQQFFRIKNISKKLKLRLKNTVIAKL